MAPNWDDLQEEQKTALRRMNRGPYPELSVELADQLIALGLAERRANAVGINRAGRELVINSLLRPRHA